MDKPLTATNVPSTVKERMPAPMPWVMEVLEQVGDKRAAFARIQKAAEEDVHLHRLLTSDFLGAAIWSWIRRVSEEEETGERGRQRAYGKSAKQESSANANNNSGHATPPASINGFGLLALSNLKSLMEFEVKDGLVLGEAYLDDLIEASARAQQEIARNRILAKWYVKIGVKLTPTQKVRDVLSHEHLMDLAIECRDEENHEIEHYNRQRLLSGRR